MKGAPKRHRDRVVSVRLSPAESQAIDDEARQRAMSKGQFLRALAMREVAPSQLLPSIRPRPPRDADVLRALAGQIGRIGASLNQLAQVTNGDEQRADLASALADLAAMRDALRGALASTKLP
jgi:hypothetical protein